MPIQRGNILVKLLVKLVHIHIHQAYRVNIYHAIEA
jgi:hypothetical protein